MNRYSKADWLIPSGLIALGFLPLLGGAIVLVELMSSSEDTGVDPRFFTAPLPIVIHIVSSAIYIILGAFQFSPGLRRARLHWHRVAGRLLLPCGIVSALSAMWMAIYYAPLFGAGITIMYIRLVVSG
jgi:hypothetical protein